MNALMAVRTNTLNHSVSSVNTFDLYKLSMSKDMAVLRRTYDRMKHDLKAKR